MEPDIIKTIDPLIDVFNEQKIEYLIGGSVASSLFGFFRATHDIDIVARIAMNYTYEDGRTKSSIPTAAVMIIYTMP